MARRVLAVGHDAYRAGAQIEFLHVLRWLSANYDADISLLLNRGGALLGTYQDLLPTTVMSPGQARPRAPIRARLDRVARARRRVAGPGDADVVYCNSAAAARLATQLAAEAGCPVVCHVHELEMSIDRFAPDFRDVSAKIDGFIAVSDAVRQNLISNHRVDPDRIHLVYEAISLPASVSSQADRLELRRELGLPEDAVVVGGSGTLDWRKAPDIYLLVAKALAQRAEGREVRFVWVGGEPEDVTRVQYDIDRLGIGSSVVFAGQRSDPGPVFDLFDAFLLTSREDPFPLVCLEAAARGVPVVCFADSGGMPEFVEADAGFVVPYLDVAAAADALALLVGDRELSGRLGRAAAAKVRSRFTIDVTGPQVRDVLELYRPLAAAGAARLPADERVQA